MMKRPTKFSEEIRADGSTSRARRLLGGSDLFSSAPYSTLVPYSYGIYIYMYSTFHMRPWPWRRRAGSVSGAQGLAGARLPLAPAWTRPGLQPAAQRSRETPFLLSGTEPTLHEQAPPAWCAAAAARAGHNRKPTFLRSCGGPAVTRLALFARHSRRSPALPPQGRPARSPAGSASVSRRRSRASRSRGSVCGSLRGTASRPRRSASADRQCGGTTGICGTAVGARKWRAHQGSKKHMDWMGVRFGW